MKSLFRQQLVLSLVITLFFVLALGTLSFWILRQNRKETPFAPPAVAFAKFLGNVPHEMRQGLLNSVNETDPNAHFQFWLFDRDGEILFPKGTSSFPLEFDKQNLPNTLFEAKTIENEKNLSPYVVVKLDEKRSEYLLVRVHGRGRTPKLFLANFVALFVSVILGTTLSLFILFYSLRQKAELADSVISELQKGNLKARFPIKKMDEIGQAMLRFNKMADEIERLVDRLKSTEKSRMSLLQELAHDLRTPVASLRSMLETVAAKRDVDIPSEVKNELLTLSLKEVNYFEDLVEDLLFLAQASEPGTTRRPKRLISSR